MFGHNTMLTGELLGVAVRALEDTLCYRLPEAIIRPVLARPAALRYLVHSAGGSYELRDGRTAVPERVDPGQRLVGDLVRHAAVLCAPSTTVQEAAVQMAAAGSSSALVDLDDSLGIVTDRDLRTRVLAAGAGPDTPLVRGHDRARAHRHGRPHRGRRAARDARPRRAPLPRARLAAKPGRGGRRHRPDGRRGALAVPRAGRDRRGRRPRRADRGGPPAAPDARRPAPRRRAGRRNRARDRDGQRHRHPPADRAGRGRAGPAAGALHLVRAGELRPPRGLPRFRPGLRDRLGRRHRPPGHRRLAGAARRARDLGPRGRAARPPTATARPRPTGCSGARSATGSGRSTRGSTTRLSRRP